MKLNSLGFGAHRDAKLITNLKLLKKPAAVFHYTLQPEVSLKRPASAVCDPPPEVTLKQPKVELTQQVPRTPPTDRGEKSNIKAPPEDAVFTIQPMLERRSSYAIPVLF